MKPIILYKKDVSGKIRFWQISVVDCEIIIEYGLINGKTTIQTEEIIEGKARRDIDEQILSRVNSRINKQKNNGYFNSIKDAENNENKNQIGFMKPMLAEKYEKVKDYIAGKEICFQHKYDGFRCLITNKNGMLYSYTRGGKIINTIDHIKEELKNIIPDGCTFDGELYNHSYTLQKIASCIKRDSPNSDTKNIEYMVYDCILDSNLNYKNRYEFLHSRISKINSNKTFTFLADTNFNTYNISIKQALENELKNGYEGLILRTLDTKYESGKRSKSLIKVKSFFDEEFLVIDIKLSEKSRPVLHCITNDGKNFKVVPMGNQEEKMYIYENRKEFIGKKVKCEFLNYTKDGIPFHPVAICWRNKTDYLE